MVQNNNSTTTDPSQRLFESGLICLENDFLNDLIQCTEFSLAEYKNSFWGRLGDSTTRLFSPLL